MNTAELAKSVRVSSLKMVHEAGASHIASALSMVDILAVLYGEILDISPENLKNENRDHFILSKGHGCASLYATLAHCGFFDVLHLRDYGKDHSNLMNHVSHKVPGVEFSTGSLGHGLPFATGLALAQKLGGYEKRTFVILGDGELDEGSNWEALLFAAHHKLDNLSIIIDNNNLQSITTIEDTLNLYPLYDKFVAFGTNVTNVDGHDHEELKKTFYASNSGAPSVIIARTVKGKGISFMENDIAWHYKSPDKEHLNRSLEELLVANAK